MKATIQRYPDSLYEELVGRACQVWQETGCEFGRYWECWQQAKSQLLVVGKPAIDHAKKEAAKLKPHVRAGRK